MSQCRFGDWNGNIFFHLTDVQNGPRRLMTDRHIFPVTQASTPHDHRSTPRLSPLYARQRVVWQGECWDTRRSLGRLPPAWWQRRHSRWLRVERPILDIIYFDTFEEGYRGRLEFFKHVPGLLAGPDSRFFFFQGYERCHPSFTRWIPGNIISGFEDAVRHPNLPFGLQRTT